jgi:hypothetical protein
MDADGSPDDMEDDGEDSETDENVKIFALRGSTLTMKRGIMKQSNELTKLDESVINET